MSLYRINMYHAVSVDLLMCLSLWCPVQEEERREVALLQAQLDAVRNVSTWSVADTIVCTNCVGVWLGVSVHKLSHVSGVRAFRVAPGTMYMYAMYMYASFYCEGNCRIPCE